MNNKSGIKLRVLSCVLFMLFVCPSASETSDESDVSSPQNSDGEVLWASDENPQTTQEEEDEKFEDITTFVKGMNDWDFISWCAKFTNLSAFNESNRPVPINVDSPDQAVLICLASKTPWLLTKQYPPSRNVNFRFVYFVDSDNQDLNITGVVKGSSGKVHTMFDYYFMDDLLEHNKVWVKQNFSIPSNLTEEGNFEVQIRGASPTTAHFAFDNVEVTGVRIKPLPTLVTPKPDTTPKPAVNVTTENPINTNQTASPSNNSTASHNVTTIASNATEVSPVVTEITSNLTTASSNLTEENKTTSGDGTTTPTVTDGGGEGGGSLPAHYEEDVNKLSRVAQAIWDAFYVFLALFCACMVALLALIIRGRCREDEPPPSSMASYNPRTNSYRLDKVYDNQSYDTQAV